MKTKPESTFDQIAYIHQYNREHYARVGLMLPPALRDELKQAAAAAGMSINAYVADAIREKLSRNEK